MGLFEQGVAQLASQLQASVALDLVVYHRGSDTISIEKKVWTGRTPFRVMIQGNSRLIWSERDFLIPVMDLKINNVLVTPETRDWIEVVFASGSQMFQPMHIPDEPFWRYSDPQNTIYRIHCKRRIVDNG